MNIVHKYRSSLVVISFFLISFFYTTYASPAQAIGVSPGTTIVSSTANGVRIPKTIRVTRPSTKGTLNFQVETHGPGSRYIELSSTSISIPPGINYAEYPYTIAPINAPNGTLQAFIQFLSLRSGSGTSTQFSIATYEGATAEILFTILDKEIKDYTIGSVSAEPIENNTAPTFTFMLKNEGNVDAQPDKIDIAIADASGTIKLTDSIIKDILPVVGPGQEKIITTSLTKKLPAGIYFADISFYNGSTSIFERKKLRFEILPEGSLEQNGELVELNLPGLNFPVGSLITVQAKFKNTGIIGVRSTLYVRVTKDGQLIDTLRSDEQYVGNKKTGIFSTSFRPTTVGNYSFEGYLSYGIKETNRRIVTAAAFSPNIAFSFPWQTIKIWLFACTPRFVPLILLILIFILTLLLLKYIALWRKHELCECSIPCACHQHKTTAKTYKNTPTTLPVTPPAIQTPPQPPAFTSALTNTPVVSAEEYSASRPVSNTIKKTQNSETQPIAEDDDPLEKFLQ
jgi:hypothetical protein